MEENPPVAIMSHTLRIVMLAMAIVMIATVAVMVVIVMNERSTQLNADRQSQQNQQLQDELQCLRSPSFEADKAEAELSIVIARGLAALAEGDGAVLVGLGPALTERADVLEKKIDLREESLTRCRQP